jgi:hypothetical protein
LHKKSTSIFGKLDFHPSPADPCLYIKKAKGNESPAYIILDVDDGVIFGTPKIIEQVMKSISSVLKVKDLGEVKNFFWLSFGSLNRWKDHSHLPTKAY